MLMEVWGMKTLKKGQTAFTFLFLVIGALPPQTLLVLGAEPLSVFLCFGTQGFPSSRLFLVLSILAMDQNVVAVGMDF